MTEDFLVCKYTELSYYVVGTGGTMLGSTRNIISNENLNFACVLELDQFARNNVLQPFSRTT